MCISFCDIHWYRWYTLQFGQLVLCHLRLQEYAATYRAPGSREMSDILILWWNINTLLTNATPGRWTQPGPSKLCSAPLLRPAPRRWAETLPAQCLEQAMCVCVTCKAPIFLVSSCAGLARLAHADSVVWCLRFGGPPDVLSGWSWCFYGFTLSAKRINIWNPQPDYLPRFMSKLFGCRMPRSFGIIHKPPIFAMSAGDVGHRHPTFAHAMTIQRFDESVCRRRSLLCRDGWRSCTLQRDVAQLAVDVASQLLWCFNTKTETTCIKMIHMRWSLGRRMKTLFHDWLTLLKRKKDSIGWGFSIFDTHTHTTRTKSWGKRLQDTANTE